MLILNGLTYKYKRGADALRDVSASLRPGVYLLMGRNGAGKTTLLHVISGLLYPAEGECQIDGIDVAKRVPDTLRSVFFLGDNMDFPSDTINGMARIHAPFFPGFSPELLAENLADFELDGNECLTQISQGARQKAKLAYALSLRTPVLLLDEPANGLDITSRQALNRMIARCVTEEMILIISTHVVWDFQNMLDGVMFMSDGELILSETVDRITDSVAFVESPVLPADAIYNEMRLGKYHAIIPNSEEMFTDIDYTLLYGALTGKSRNRLLDTIITEIS